MTGEKKRIQHGLARFQKRRKSKREGSIDHRTWARQVSDSESSEGGEDAPRTAAKKHHRPRWMFATKKRGTKNHTKRARGGSLKQGLLRVQPERNNRGGSI